MRNIAFQQFMLIFYLTTFLLYLSPSTLYGVPPIPIFLLRYLYCAILLSIAPTPNPILAMVPFSFSVFCSYHVITPEHVSFGASNKMKHVVLKESPFSKHYDKHELVEDFEFKTDSFPCNRKQSLQCYHTSSALTHVL